MQMVGPVSVSPYAISTLHQVRIFRTRSGDTGAPATTPVRSAVRSRPAKVLSRIRSWNIVGTPWQTVTRSCSRSSSAPPASNRSCSTRVPPTQIVPTTVETPKTWKNGTAASARSPSRSSSASALSRAVSTRLRWESRTPFGFPIVPEV